MHGREILQSTNGVPGCREEEHVGYGSFAGGGKGVVVVALSYIDARAFLLTSTPQSIMEFVRTE